MGICHTSIDTEDDEEDRIESKIENPQTKMVVKPQMGKLKTRNLHRTYYRGEHDSESESSSDEEDDLQMPKSMQNRPKYEFTIGLDLDSGSKGVGVMFLSKVRIVSGKFSNMNASGINLSFYRKREEMQKKAGVSTTNKRIFDPLKLLGRSNDTRSIKEMVNQIFPDKMVEIENHMHNKMNKELLIKVFDSRGVQRVMSSSEILARIVRKMKKESEKYLRRKVRSACVVSPADLNFKERKLLKNSLRKIGLQIIRSVTGATSCGLYYVYKHLSAESDEHILIVSNHGNNYSNLSTLKIQYGVIEILGSKSMKSTSISGFIKIIEAFILSEIKNLHQHDYCSNPQIRKEIRNEIERIFNGICKPKRGLSRPRTEWTITIKNIIPKKRDPNTNASEINEEVNLKDNIWRSEKDDFVYKLTKDKLQELLKNVIDESCNVVTKMIDSLIEKQRISKKEDISKLILVGDLIRYEPLKAKLDKILVSKQKIDDSVFSQEEEENNTIIPNMVNHEEEKTVVMETSAITYGSAILGSMLQGETKLILQNAIPFGVGFGTEKTKIIKLFNKLDVIPSKNKVIVRCKSSSKGFSISVFELLEENGTNVEFAQNNEVIGFYNCPLPPSKTNEEYRLVEISFKMLSFNCEIYADLLTKAHEEKIHLNIERRNSLEFELPHSLVK